MDPRVQEKDPPRDEVHRLPFSHRRAGAAASRSADRREGASVYEAGLSGIGLLRHAPVGQIPVRRRESEYSRALNLAAPRWMYGTEVLLGSRSYDPVIRARGAHAAGMRRALGVLIVAALAGSAANAVSAEDFSTDVPATLSGN